MNLAIVTKLLRIKNTIEAKDKQSGKVFATNMTRLRLCYIRRSPGARGALGGAHQVRPRWCTHPPRGPKGLPDLSPRRPVGPARPGKPPQSSALRGQLWRPHRRCERKAHMPLGTRPPAWQTAVPNGKGTELMSGRSSVQPQGLPQGGPACGDGRVRPLLTSRVGRKEIPEKFVLVLAAPRVRSRAAPPFGAEGQTARRG